MDRLFEVVKAGIREDAEVDGPEGDRGGIVRFGGGNVEGFPSLLQHVRADQLNEGLDPVEQSRSVRPGHGDTGGGDNQSVPVVRGKRAVRAVSDRKGEAFAAGHKLKF